MLVQWDLNQGPRGAYVEVLFPDQPPNMIWESFRHCESTGHINWLEWF